MKNFFTVSTTLVLSKNALTDARLKNDSTSHNYRDYEDEYREYQGL
jgi:hypothetical protein